MRWKERGHRGLENPPQLQRHSSKLASHKLCFHPQGGPEAGSTTSTQTIQSTEASLWAGPVSGRHAGRVEGTWPSTGVILDALSLLPWGHPSAGSWLSWEGLLVSRSWEDVGFGRRPGLQHSRPSLGKALPQCRQALDTPVNISNTEEALLLIKRP